MLETFCIPARAAPSEPARFWDCVHRHKWLCTPKGAGFLYTLREVQPLLEPLVVSWGWEPEETNLLSLDASASRFVREQEWQGTLDPAAYLSVPATIQFQADHNWPRVQADCHELLQEARKRTEELTGLPPLCPDMGRPGFHTRRGVGANGIPPHEWYAQMAAFPLPPCDGAMLQRRLYDEYWVEVPVIEWDGMQFVRVSVQGCKSAADLGALVSALLARLPQAIPAS